MGLAINPEPMNVCVIGGAGYVGLVTGLGLAEIGHHVINVDVDRARVTKLLAAESPIHEEGLTPLLVRNLESERINFSTNLGPAVSSSDVVFIAVGTPSRADGQADLSQVVSVAEEMVQHIDGYKVIVVKSTVPVGTVELVRGMLAREKLEGKDFDIVTNPEFLREGKSLYDFFYPDRIVIGTCSEKAKAVMRRLYDPIVQRKVDWQDGQLAPHGKDPVPVVETDPASAQMIKYASNAFLAARVSFINEVAGLCEKVGADVREVGRGMGFDPRIGSAYLDAGLGFGGPCLEKDLRALMKIAEDNGYELAVLRSVLDRNERQLGEVLGKVKQLVGYLLYKKTIAVFGLSFKAGTNDVRNSLALKVVDRLEQEGAIVQAHDPIAMPEARALLPNVKYCESPYDAVHQADALLILTEWPSFRDLDYDRIKDCMATPRIVDCRNLLDHEALKGLGFMTLGIGRP